MKVKGRIITAAPPSRWLIKNLMNSIKADRKMATYWREAGEAGLADFLELTATNKEKKLAELKKKKS